MTRPYQQNGFVLLPVVLAIVLTAVIAFMLNNQGVLEVGAGAGEAEIKQAEYVTIAGMQHAAWAVQDSACGGDMTLASVPFGSGSYTATIDAGGTTSTSYSFTPDHDTWIKEAVPDENNASDSVLSAKVKPGDSFSALYHYDLSSIPGNKKVVTATAWFYVDQNDDQGAVTLHRLTTPWTETDATWNTMASNYESSVYGIIPPQPTIGVWVPVNVTALAQSWVNSPAINYGFLLNAIVSDKESRFTSREHGTASLRPYLEVTTADVAVSPVQITATGILAGNPSPANDISRTLTHTAVPAYQPPGTQVLQPDEAGEDSYIHDGSQTTNFGTASSIRISNKANSQKRGLLHFALGGIPAGAKVTSATLELNLEGIGSGAVASVDVHRATKAWEELEVNWLDASWASFWNTLGGDWDPAVIDTAVIDPVALGSTTWDLTQLVADWINGTYANNGVFLIGSDGLNHADFTTSDSTDPTLRPKLTITYACECGNPCLAPQGSGNILFVVDSKISMVPNDLIIQAYLESWGYTVNLISDQASQPAFITEFNNNDVVLISNSVNSGTLGTKVSAAPIGIVSAEETQNDELGLATGNASPVGDTINVVDNDHYITRIFPPGPLRFKTVATELASVAGTVSPDAKVLADIGGAGSLIALDAGGQPAGGGTVSSRRALVPVGDIQVSWGYLTNNGLLVVQRALAWAMGADADSLGNVLLVVVNPAALNAQEAARKSLIEGWGFTVNLIDDNASQTDFDTAIAANDVAYVPASIVDTNLGTKLTNATIGVVNEAGELVDELGFANGVLSKSRDEIDVIDNSHYITETFATGLLTITSSLQSVHILDGGAAPGLQVLGDAFNTGSQWKQSMGTLDTGDELSGGGSAAGRRVKLPWGGATFDINALNDDGRTIMKRSIEWGATVPDFQQVLMVVADPAALTASEANTKTLIESWGYVVDLIDDNDTQTNFDTAASTVDVAFVTSDVDDAALGTKLTDATIGVVIEEHQTWGDFELCSDRSGTGSTDMDITDNSHYISSPFSTGPLTILTSAADIMKCTGTSAAGVDPLIILTGKPGLLTLDTGALGLNGQPSAGRRVTTPWGGTWDSSKLNNDGQTILRRSIEWAAGAGAGTTTPPNLLMVVGNAGSLTTEETEHKNLVESWGYTVEIIDDGATQAEFDTAVANNDVVFTTNDITASTLGTKLVNATIGVVTSEVNLSDEFGLSSAIAWDSGTVVEINDNSHYITSPFSLGLLTILSASESLAYVTGSLSPDLAQLASSTSGYGIVTLDTGDSMDPSGNAAGRRAQLPWGGNGFDPNTLTADGQTILKRALEWASGEGSGGGGGGGGGVLFEEMRESSDSNTTSLNIQNPGGTTPGDLLVAAVATDGNTTATLAAPAGWNVIHVADESGAVTFGVWWKLAGASEPGSYDFTWSGSEHVYGWIMRFSGHDPVSPIDVSANAGGSSSTPSSPAVTTTVDDALILRLGGFDDDDITAGDPGLTGHTAINMGDSGNGPTTASGGSGYILQTTAGSSGTATFSLTATENYRTVTIAIKSQ